VGATPGESAGAGPTPKRRSEPEMRLRILSSVIVLCIAVLAVMAWKRNTQDASSVGNGGEATAPPGETEMPSVGDPATPAQDPGVAWQTPTRWVEELATGMRLATYVIPAPVAGGEAARCAVYYFGPGQGGGTDANIERWIGEFESPSDPVRRDSEVRGFRVSRVEVTGTYRAHADPAQGSSAPSPNWTLIGAIVEGPHGAVFFKLTGPSGSAAPAAKEFDGLLASLRKK
jgi:hypothetical protein